MSLTEVTASPSTSVFMKETPQRQNERTYFISGGQGNPSAARHKLRTKDERDRCSRHRDSLCKGPEAGESELRLSRSEKAAVDREETGQAGRARAQNGCQEGSRTAPFVLKGDASKGSAEKGHQQQGCGLGGQAVVYGSSQVTERWHQQEGTERGGYLRGPIDGC